MIRAILLDKDGTLTDFRATWEVWSGALIRELAAETGMAEARLGAAYGYDVEARRLQADGLFVTAPYEATLAALARATGRDADDLRRWLRRRVPPRQVVVGSPPALLTGLRARGLALGVLTNAERRPARAELEAMGAWPHLDALVAADDGHGAKPRPAGALAFAAGLGCAPGEVLVVGDGLADMQAAHGAGMPFVGVLTGTRTRAGFAGAAAVLPDVTHLPDWLDAR